RFEPGEASKTFNININDDDMYEFDEDFEIFIEKVVDNVTLGRATATVSIRSEDLPPVAGIYAAEDNEITEGEDAVFTVTISAPFSDNPGDEPTSIPVLISQAGDFLFGDADLSREVVFAPNQTTATFAVASRDDLTAERDGLFRATVLSDGASRWLVDAQNRVAEYDVLDNETPEILIRDLRLFTSDRRPSGCTGAIAETNCGPVAFFDLSRPAPEGGAVFEINGVENGILGSDIVIDSEEGPRTLTIAAGQTSAVAEFRVFNDMVHENDTTFTISIVSPPTGYRVKPGSSFLTFVVEDRNAPAAGVNADIPNFENVTVRSPIDEDAGTLDISLSLNAASQDQISLRVRTVGAVEDSFFYTASSPDDYIAFDEYVVFPPGTTTRTVSIQIVDDEIGEVTENFRVVFDNVINAYPTPARRSNSGVGTRIVNITDDDATVGISTPLAEITEGNPGGENNISVVFDILPELTGDHTFTYTVTETGLGDHANSSDLGQQTFTYLAASHGTRETQTVRIDHDRTNEGDSVVTVELDTDSLPANYNVFPGQERFEVRVINDDSAPSDAPRANLSVESNRINENSGDIVATVALSNTTYTSNVYVNYGARDGPDGTIAATSPDDFAAITGTLTFEPGAPASQTFTISVIDDEITEADEDFEIFITSPIGARLGNALQRITILANDPAPGLSIAPVSSANASITEGEQAVWTITAERAISSLNEVRVPVVFLEMAVNGSSYLLGEAPTEAVFAAGATSAQVTADTADDDTTEEDGVFRLSVGDDPVVGAARWEINDDSRTGEITVQDNELPTV
ncbi:MAG: hypothetical protein OXF42_05850, partial [Candidatus Dadabacteria bacterium]|nr:hypothetical protein [Candidatus Dadabacteria bacterium]